MTKTLSRVDYILLCSIYPLLFIIAFLQTRAILPPHYFPTTGIIVWPLRILVFIIGVKCLIKYCRKNQLVVLFLIYSLLSIVSYFINGFPLSLYALSSITFLGPVLFVFLGYDGNEKTYFKFYESFFWSCAICCAIGIVLYFVRPDWYNTAVIEVFNNKATEQYTTERIFELARYASFLGDSYAISYITMSSLPIGLFLGAHEKENKKRRLLFCACLVIYFSSLLCQHRASMFCTTMILLWFMFRRNRKSALSFLIVLILLISIITILVLYGGENDVVSMILERFGQMSYDETMGIRSDQTTGIMSTWNNYLFGEGIGSGCGFAISYGLNSIPDGAYIELLYEIGILGFIFFLFITIKPVAKMWKYRGYLFVEISIVLSMLITMTGAGPFVYFFYMIPFWFAIGRLLNLNYLKYLQDNQYKI